jgi:hypothetical protein
VSDILNGYAWDPKVQRYRYTTGRQRGRFISRTKILGLLESSTNARETQMREGLQAVMDGKLLPDVFLRRTAELLKRQYVQLTALAAGGWDQVTQRDWGRVGGRIRNEYSYLARFAGELSRGEISHEAAIARLHQYMGNAQKVYYETEREHLPVPPPGMVLIERRVLGASEGGPCPDCVEKADRGWQPAGTLDVPGEGSVCDGNCRCRMLRKEIPVEELNNWIGTKR